MKDKAGGRQEGHGEKNAEGRGRRRAAVGVMRRAFSQIEYVHAEPSTWCSDRGWGELRCSVVGSGGGG
jgi:hypothetical protein